MGTKQRTEEIINTGRTPCKYNSNGGLGAPVFTLQCSNSPVRIQELNNRVSKADTISM